MKPKDKEPKKKAYHKPELRIYGNVRELTEAQWSDMGALDGANYGKPLKTGG